MSVVSAPLCHTMLGSQDALVGSLFLAGLVGSATHCAGMCGPFVLSQVTTRLDTAPMAQLSEWQRLRGAALLPYHLGRMTTYALMGVAATTIVAPFRDSAAFHALAFVALAVAGLMFIASAFRFLPADLVSFSVVPRVPAKAIAGVKAVLDQLFAAPRGLRGYALGLILGLLPCGLVYASLLAVFATGNPLKALAGMAAFALGTIPALIAVGYGGQHVFRRLGSASRYVMPGIMIINGAVLLAMAGGFV